MTDESTPPTERRWYGPRAARETTRRPSAGVLSLGLIGTAVYVTLVGAFLATKWSAFVALELNAFGDFVAGTVGPLAIFWLVLGFFLQRAELQQNTEALEKSAKHQDELARATTAALNDSRDATLRTMMPKFQPSMSTAQYGGGTAFDVLNDGASVFDVRISSSNGLEILLNPFALSASQTKDWPSGATRKMALMLNRTTWEGRVRIDFACRSGDRKSVTFLVEADRTFSVIPVIRRLSHATDNPAL